ncbi:MAG: hypothetical protein LPJ98_11390, partial [Cyclobacteriaceae bacterium]|nr:hypothetical protein [Cyclobacteriaceae bacterium]
MSRLIMSTALLFMLSVYSIFGVRAQSGDQILDGIGETDLIARYLFNGDFKDWSRNNLNAVFQGQNANFVNDDRFGKVLSLNGKRGGFITVPKEALENVESLSITAWVKFGQVRSGQQLL